MSLYNLAKIFKLREVELLRQTYIYYIYIYIIYIEGESLSS